LHLTCSPAQATRFGFENQHGKAALDHEYAGQDRKQESDRELSEFARQAKPVVLPLARDESWPRKDDSVRPRGISIGPLLAVAFSLAIAGFSIYILGHVLAGVRWSAVRQAIAATSLEQIVAATFFTALSYLTLTGYDGLALHQLKVRVPYKTASLASFTSYAISFTLGFPLIIAGTVRYWIYSQKGLTASKVASLTVIAGATYLSGSGILLGAGLAFHAGAISAINHLWPILNVLMGVAIIGTALAYFVWATIKRRDVSFKGFRLELPGPGLWVGQITLGVIDQCMAAAALYMLLPSHDELDYFTFATVYVFGCVLGVASNSPGGIGVFEAAMLKSLPIASGEALLASLVLFRVIYYLVPFIFGLAFLGAHEGVHRWNTLREAMRLSEEETVLEDLIIDPLRRWYRDYWRRK
jgi:glycosyltransferase 2 family protein